MADHSRSRRRLRRRLTVYDLFSGGQEELREIIRDATDYLEIPALFGPLFTITHELVVNGLKAVYKKVFFEKFIVEIGLEDITYEEWLMLFKTEIEAHNAENFARVVRESDLGVEVSLDVREERLRIVVTNHGKPSAVEMSRIRRSLERSRELEELSDLLEQMNSDEGLEGASLGIPLIVMSLRKLGVDERNFEISVRWGRTWAGLSLPLKVLEKYALAVDL